MKTFVIAEIGSAWRYGSDVEDKAITAIRIASEAGASAVKFQWTSNPRKMEKRRNVPDYSYELLAWPQIWIEKFARACKQQCIEFMCTVFLPEDVKFISQYVRRFKVASLESRYDELLDAMTGEIIVSHGASDRGRYIGMRNLHCTAAYPAPLSELNLNVIKSGYDGYSDHSANLMTGALAVAAGAKIIEVHFRLDRTPKINPDYKHSLCPDKLKRYILNICEAELMLGDGIKRVERCEQWALRHQV